MPALSCSLKWILLAVVAGSAAWPARAAPPAAGMGQEFEIKAAFLYHLSQFVEWPPRTGERAFTVCVLGADPYGDKLKQLESRRYRNQPMVTAYPQNATLARDCQIVYVGSDLRASVPAILKQLRGYPVLTVSSLPGFVDQGGGVGFVVENSRVRLELNSQAARGAQLKLSARLLEVARRVVDSPVEDKP
jgi:hypothetical protein